MAHHVRLSELLLVAALAATWGTCVLASSQQSDSRATPVPDAAPLDTRAILERLADRNRIRNEALHSYAVDRTYSIENKRVKKSASVCASMVFLSPGEKLFEVTSASGSGFLRKSVLNRMIETERTNAAPGLKERSAITPDNYDMALLKQEAVEGRPQYVLRAKPRRKDQLLFDGNIWVDAEDFAITRVEAKPAKKPSFWTRKVTFVHEYGRFGEFWLPVRNRSKSSVWFFGETTTDIEYKGYRINEPSLEARAAELRKLGTKLEVHIDKKDKQ